MTSSRAPSTRSLCATTAPLIALTLAGLITAWAHLSAATYALGAWTFPLAIALPAIAAGRMLLDDQSTWRTTLACLAVIALNLTIEALGTTAQLALLT